MRGKPFDKNDPRINRGGRPKGVASLRAGLQRVVSREDCERMGLRLVGMARRGNLRAMKLVGELLGDLGNSPLAVALAQTAVAQTCNDAGNVHLYLPQKDGAPDAVQFNVGVSALELPEGESRLTGEQWVALIALLEAEGGQLVKRGESIVHVPATKGEIDLEGVSNLARQLYGMATPKASGNGSGGPAPAVPAAALPPPPQPAAELSRTRPPAPEKLTPPKPAPAPAPSKPPAAISEADLFPVTDAVRQELDEVRQAGRLTRHSSWRSRNPFT